MLKYLAIFIIILASSCKPRLSQDSNLAGESTANCQTCSGIFCQELFNMKATKLNYARSQIEYTCPLTNKDLLVSITGEPIYPNPYVFANLGLKRFIEDVAVDVRSELAPIFSTPRFKEAVLDLGPKDMEAIYDIGAGTSGVAPALQKKGFKVKAVDISYDAIEASGLDLSRMSTNTLLDDYNRAFVKAHKEILVTDDTTSLKKLPNASAHLVLSHMLFDYLPQDAQVKMIEASLRVLMPFGEIRFAMASGNKTPEEIVKNLRNILNPIRNGNLQYQIQYGWVEAKSKLPEDAAYPSDALPWEEFQKVLGPWARPFPIVELTRTGPVGGGPNVLLIIVNS